MIVPFKVVLETKTYKVGRVLIMQTKASLGVTTIKDFYYHNIGFFKNLPIEVWTKNCAYDIIQLLVVVPYIAD